MAQLNLYVPSELAARLKRDAEADGKSLSKYVIDKLLSTGEPKPAFPVAFWENLANLPPIPEDFVAPSRVVDIQERDISFDDISS